MKKLIILAGFMILLSIAVFLVGLTAEYHMKKQDMIRLHVVGASNETYDQQIKLLVRDAVLHYMQEDVQTCSNAQQVQEYLLENLDGIEQMANSVLEESGSTDCVRISLCKEEFPMRAYDTFSLPSGVYTSLRINIGKAEGKNWWCVVFPSFCIGASSDAFLDTAAAAGFSQPLRDTLVTQNRYQIRFFFLDWIGKLENFFHF